ncbi:MAG: ATP-binding protein [Acidobacteriota bacterium]|nr:ATP-binding protein [Acidobacteriota bacterium]
MIWRSAERAAQAEYERFFRLSVDLLCVAGFDGYFKLLNPAWEKTLGHSLAELAGRPYLDFVHPSDRESTLAEAGRIAEGVTLLSFDNRYRTKDGSYRWLHWTAVPKMDEERIYAVAHDVTEQRSRQEALEMAKAAAEKANSAKSEFLASMSHELRTPLNAVIGFSDVLLAAPDEFANDSRRQYLKRIRTNGTRLLRLINRILDLEKTEAGKVELDLEDVGLASLVEDVVEEFAPLAAEQGISFSADVPSDLRTIRTDYERLRGIVVNLLSNAVKFAPGGRVVVRVVTDSDNRSPAALEVEDSGIGIPPDKLDVIFERFEQLDVGASRRFGGSGLGLPISRAQCNLLGFGLSVDSELGKGSTFRIALGPPMQGLPESGERDSQAIALKIVQELEAEHRRPLFENAVVLVIDEDADSRLVLTELLQAKGCQVLAAATIRKGLQLARAHSPALITIDPFSSASSTERVIELLGADRRLQHSAVIAITAAPAEMRQSLPAEVGFLRKPARAADLERALARNLTPRVGRVLLVESNASDCERIETCLRPRSSEWRQVESGREALAELTGYTPDIALIELGREHVGEALIAEMRREPHLSDVVVVLTTGEDLRIGELERIGRDSAPVIRKGPQLEANLRELCWELGRRKAG